MGLSDKLAELKTRFSITTPKESYLHSINQARHCIAHRRGIVGTEDLNDGDKLRLRWWTIDLFAVTPSGERISLSPPIPPNGILLDEGAAIKIGVVDKDRQYSCGEVFEITASDLSEICFLVRCSTDEIQASALAYVQSIGVEIVQSKREEEGESRE